MSTSSSKKKRQAKPKEIATFANLADSGDPPFTIGTVTITNTTATTATSGAGSVPTGGTPVSWPAPAIYLEITISGTTYKFPGFNV